MSEKEKAKISQQTKNIPKDGQVIISIMKEMGITEYEPKTITQLTDFVYKYATSVLEDARSFANNSKKKLIDIEDVRLALQLNNENTFTVPPPREAILELVQNKNVVPLPLIKPHCGLRLPPDRHCLSSTNYTLKMMSHKGKQKQLTAGSQALSGIKIVTKPAVSYIRRTNTVPINKQSVGISKNIPNVNQPKTVLKPKIQIQQSINVSAPHSSFGGSPMEFDLTSLKRKREDDDIN